MKTKQTKEELDKSIGEDTVIEPKTCACKKISDINEDDKKTTPDEPKTSKEAKKRRRLHSVSKTSDTAETPEDCKKLKRERSYSRDGSEISKCSDNTESDLSMSETLNDIDSKELNIKLDKSKTDLEIDVENNVQISTIEEVPSLVVDSKLAETKLDPPEPSSNIHAKDEKLSLNTSTSLDSDNNNSDRMNLDDLNSNEIEEKIIMKTDDTLFDARSSILTSMFKTFNSEEMSKNIRKVRQGRKVMASSRPEIPSASSAPAPAPVPASSASENCITSTITKLAETKLEPLEPSSNIHAKDKKLKLNRGTSLDSDNNNSDRINLDDLNSNEIEGKMIMKTDNTLFDARSSILTSMSKTFNSEEMSKNIRKVRQGRKVMAASRPVAPSPGPTPAPVPASTAPKTCITSTITKIAETKLEPLESSSNIHAKDKKLSLNRDTSLDSDNNNSNRINLDDLNSNEIEDKIIMKTVNTLFDARCSILTSMSKIINSEEMSKNIRKARRGRKVMAASRPVAYSPVHAPAPAPVPAPATAPVPASTLTPVPASSAPKNCITSTISADAADDKVETIDTLTKEINDLINDLDRNIDGDLEMVS